MNTRSLVLIISCVGIIVSLLVAPSLSSKVTDMDRAGSGIQCHALNINDKLPVLSADAYYKGNITKINLGDYKGKWVVVVFYPADFTFVCPTELEELAALYKNFTAEGAEVFSVSRDTAYVHKAWHDSDSRVGKVEFPMLSDTTGDICRAFGTYNKSNGLSQRASFIFDPDGNLKAYEIHDDGFGRNTKELLRELEAAKFVREHGGQLCPAGWKPGEETIKP